ncbi:MAG: FMN-binding protein [Salinivirgaceae bacterium]|nr:MAG: FMN-binding protein [Salinivirgaceae bacterium]
MIKYLIILTGMLFSQMHTAQTYDIEHQNKILLRTLSKSFDIEQPEFKTVKLSNTLKKKYEVKGELFKVINSDNSYLYIYSGRVFSCRTGGCSAPDPLSNNHDGEYFDYFAIFDQQGNVTNVRVFNYQATHGQGVTSKGWLKQFTKLAPNETPTVNQNIDGISGATISTYAITDDMATRMKMIKEVIKN